MEFWLDYAHLHESDFMSAMIFEFRGFRAVRDTISEGTIAFLDFELL